MLKKKKKENNNYFRVHHPEITTLDIVYTFYLFNCMFIEYHMYNCTFLMHVCITLYIF